MFTQRRGPLKLDRRCHAVDWRSRKAQVLPEHLVGHRQKLLVHNVLLGRRKVIETEHGQAHNVGLERSGRELISGQLRGERSRRRNHRVVLVRRVDTGPPPIVSGHAVIDTFSLRPRQECRQAVRAHQVTDMATVRAPQRRGKSGTPRNSLMPRPLRGVGGLHRRHARRFLQRDVDVYATVNDALFGQGGPMAQGDRDRRCSNQSRHCERHVRSPMHGHASGLAGQPDQPARGACNEV